MISISIKKSFLRMIKHSFATIELNYPCLDYYKNKKSSTISRNANRKTVSVRMILCSCSITLLYVHKYLDLRKVTAIHLYNLWLFTDFDYLKIQQRYLNF